MGFPGDALLNSNKEPGRGVFPRCLLGRKSRFP
jgi:hypothetical protein